MRVLLVEPDLRLARDYAASLRLAGHSVVARTTAQAAISAADRRRPDVVVLELQLTNHGGIEFLYEFRSYQDWQCIPVIVASSVPATAFAANRQLLYGRLGVVDYIYKPNLTLRGLGVAVEAALAAAVSS